MQKPEWRYWLNRADVTLAEAVFLSCDVDPRSIDNDSSNYVRAEEVSVRNECEQRLELAVEHLRNGSLKQKRWKGEYDTNLQACVTLADFRSFGESLHSPFGFPDEFPRAETKTMPNAKAVSAEQDDKPLEPRERATLLRIICALSEMERKLPDTGAAKLVEMKLESLGFGKPKEAAIKKWLDAARAEKPDKSQ